MRRTTSEIEAEIEALYEERYKIIQEDKITADFVAQHQLAIILHDKLCNLTHPDECDFYFKDKDLDKFNPAPSIWLNKVKALCAKCNELSIEQIKSVIENL